MSVCFAFSFGWSAVFGGRVRPARKRTPMASNFTLISICRSVFGRLSFWQLSWYCNRKISRCRHPLFSLFLSQHCRNKNEERKSLATNWALSTGRPTGTDLADQVSSTSKIPTYPGSLYHELFPDRWFDPSSLFTWRENNSLKLLWNHGIRAVQVADCRWKSIKWSGESKSIEKCTNFTNLNRVVSLE